MPATERSSAPRVLLATSSWPSSGAPYNGVFVREQALSLAALGVPVSVVAPRVFRDDPVRGHDGALPIRRFRFATEERLLVEYARPPVARMATYLVSGAAACLAEGRRFRAEVLHSHFALPTGVLAGVAAAMLRLPSVLTVHRGDIELALRSRGATRRLASWALLRADRVIAVSEDMRDKCGELGLSPERVMVLPMGVDALRFAPGEPAAARSSFGLPPEAPTALFVGGLTEVKGVRTLLDAWPTVIGGRPGAVLALAGEGPLEAALRAAADAHGVAGSVALLGAVGHERMPELMRAADVVVLPSSSEGLPVVLMEAAATGVRVVATDVGGNREVAVLDPESALVPEGDPGELAAALLAALRRGSGPRPGRVRGTRFDATVCAAELERLYRELAGV